MDRFEREGDFRLELHARAKLPPPATRQSERLYDRLRELADRPGVGSVDRAEWATRVPVADCERELRDTYLRFERWADRAGVSLQPFFGTRECFSAERGEWVDWLVLPALCLAVSDGESMVAVYPHGDGTETRTVEDGIEALERDVSAPIDGRPALAD